MRQIELLLHITTWYLITISLCPEDIHSFTGGFLPSRVEMAAARDSLGGYGWYHLRLAGVCDVDARCPARRSRMVHAKRIVAFLVDTSSTI
jgi:hypothetical protein